MKVIAFLSLGVTALMLSACNGSVTDFVRGAPPQPLPPIAPIAPIAQSDGTIPLKVSPGRFEGAGGGYSIWANVTTTDRLFPANDYSARLTISRSRGKVQ